jgi:hypothetical protein
MREVTVPASDREMARADDEIMRAGHFAVPTGCFLDQLPDRVLSDFCKKAFCIDIFTAGHEYSRCSTIIAPYLRLVRHGFDDLISIFFTVIAVSAISGVDEPVAHGRYWMRWGSLTCCRIYHTKSFPAGFFGSGNSVIIVEMPVTLSNGRVLKCPGL